MTSMPLAGTPSLGQTPEAPSSSTGLLSSILPHPLQLLQDAQKKQAWASWVETEYSKCKTARSVFERQWYINMAFYSGKHYVAPVDVPNAGFRLIAPKAPPWRVRLVINKIRTSVRTECAKLTSSKPIPTVVPATTEDEDFMAARVGEQLLRSAFANSEFEKTYRSFVWWGVVTGNSYLKSYWNPTEIDPNVQNPPQPMMGMDGQPIVDPNTQQPIMMPAPVVKGKICMERVTPFHIYVPDLLCEDINKQPYLMHVSTRSVLWVKDNFNIDATADTKATDTIMEAATLIAKGAHEHLDSVMVKEVWIKPHAHPDFPEGGLLTVINSKVVQVQDKWPWPFKEYPFYKYDGIPTGGFYTDSSVVDLIPIQKEYNRTKSQMIEIKNISLKPKLLYAKGSINPRQISSEPGQGIPYVAGFPAPVIMQPPEIPMSMGVELDRLSSDFDDISGQHEITRGNTPAQVTSGTAIAFLQEQDDSKLSFQVSSIENCMELLGEHYLKYVSHYWEDERLIRTVGLDNNFEARHWKGSDLRGNTDVKIQTGSALPVSKAAKQAMITEFMQNGWIDPASGLEILDLGGFEKVMEDFLTDKRQAQRENLKMAEIDPQILATLLNPPVDQQTGQPVQGPPNPATGKPQFMDPLTGQPWNPQPPLPVNSWDNHQVHVHTHNQFRKSQQFELLDPEVKKAFELHVQLHQMALVSPQMGAAGVVANQMPMGAPGGEAGLAAQGALGQQPPMPPPQ